MRMRSLVPTTNGSTIDGSGAPYFALARTVSCSYFDVPESGAVRRAFALSNVL